MLNKAREIETDPADQPGPAITTQDIVIEVSSGKV